MACRLAFLACLCLSFSAAGEENWPRFRGHTSGVSDVKNLPTEWGLKQNIVWAADVPGKGWSSPIVWGDRVIVTTVETDGKFEDAKKGLYFGGERMKASTDKHHWKVICYDFKSGKPLWEKAVHSGVPESSYHIKNSLASETPATDGERIIAYFGNLGVYCLDLDGKLLWTHKIDPTKTRFGWGTAASPALHKGRVYIVNDNEEKSYLLCLDAKSGKPLWNVERDEKSNWATPFVWENELRTELVTAGTNRVRSYDLDGKLLWELGGMSSITIPTPFARHGLLYIASGYVLDRKSKPIYAIKPGAKGDISLKEEEENNAFVVWSRKDIGPYNPTPLVYGDYLYVLYDQGLFACYEARTGKEVYAKERIDRNASAFTASPWAYGDKIFCLSEDGDTFVIQAGPKYKVLGINRLEEMALATPALVKESLVLRTARKLYRIENQAGGHK